jgi:hypothetical protein
VAEGVPAAGRAVRVHLDSADKQALATIAIWALAAFFAVIGVALLAGLALRVFQITSGGL